MKKKMLFMVFAALIIGGCFCGCSSSEDNDEQGVKYIGNTRVQISPKASLPVWLIEKIDHLESINEGYQVKRGVYKGETFFWLVIYNSSCPGCDLYDSEGNWFMDSKVLTEDNDTYNLLRIEWEIIYANPTEEEILEWWETTGKQLYENLIPTEEN